METVQSFINCSSRFSHNLHVYKLLQLSDPTNSFIVRKLIKGCNNLSRTIDTRIPITMDILKNIMQGIEPAVQDFYLNNVTCYFPFSFWCIIALRVNCSKILCWLRKNSSTWGHLYFLQGWTPYQFIVYFATFQNNKKNNQSVHISIEAQSNLPKVCPVLPMDHYLKICRPTQGPLFQFRSGSPVTHKFVSTNLANILEFNGIKKSQFPHWRCNSFGKPRFLRNLY